MAAMGPEEVNGRANLDSSACMPTARMRKRATLRVLVSLSPASSV